MNDDQPATPVQFLPDVKQDQHREILAADEYKALCRLRQLKAAGARLAIIEFSEKRIRVRKVGELEG